MQTLFNGVEVFTNSDDYDLANDVAKAFKTANLIIPVANENVREALPDKYPGMTVSRLDLGARLETYNGAGWITHGPYAEFANTALLNSPVPANGQLGPFYQTFPPGRFTVTPLVTLGVSNARLTAACNNPSKDGFDLFVRNDTGVEAVLGAIITFTAKQMTATSAAG